MDLYTKQCALSVTAHDLAAMGATLADGGVNPLTNETVVDATACRYALAVIATAGMYETSGDWLCGIDLPGKSGIGGDPAGNSVHGVLAARSLSERLGHDLFVSAPLD